MRVHANGQSFDVSIDDLTNNTNVFLGQTLTTAEQENLSVLLIVFEHNGLGDLVFGSKFATYLVNQWPELWVTVVVSNQTADVGGIEVGQALAFDFVTEAVEENLHETINMRYAQGTEGHRQMYHRNGKITVVNTFGRVPGGRPCVIDTDVTNVWFDIMFVTPKLPNPREIYITGKWANKTYQKLSHNSYCWGEYNGSTRMIATGVPYTNCNRNQTGLMLESLDKFNDLPPYLTSVLDGRPFSIVYVYAGSTFIGGQVNGPHNLLNNAVGNKLANLTLMFHEYTRKLKSLRMGQIVVAVKQGETQPIIDFCNRVAGGHYSFAGDMTQSRRDKIAEVGVMLTQRVTADFEFIEACKVPKANMMGMYQRSLPVVFVSGDQSLTDFLSANKYLENAAVYYQVFDWKDELAWACGIPQNHGVGEIPEANLKTLRTNPIVDFRLRGLTIAESLLKYASSNHTAGSSRPFVQCNPGDTIGTNEYAGRVEALQLHAADFIYGVSFPGESPRQANLSISTQVRDFTRKINYIPGKPVANWFMGSKSGNIYLSEYPYASTEPPSETGCSRLSFSVHHGGNLNVSSALMAVSLAKITNQAILRGEREDKTEGELRAMGLSDSEVTYTLRAKRGEFATAPRNFSWVYGTLDNSCRGRSTTGMTLYHELLPTSTSLNDFLRDPSICTVGTMCEILYQVCMVIRAFRTTAMANVSHNSMADFDKALRVEHLPNKTRLVYKYAYDGPDGTHRSYAIKTRYLLKVSGFGPASAQLGLVPSPAESEQPSWGGTPGWAWVGERRVYSRGHTEAYNHRQDMYDFMNTKTYFQPFAGEGVTRIEAQLRNMFDDVFRKHPGLAGYPKADFAAAFSGREIDPHSSPYKSLLQMKRESPNGYYLFQDGSL